MAFKCPCCGKALMLSLSAVGGDVAVVESVKPDKAVDGVVWCASETSARKPCLKAFQRDNLVGSDLSPAYAELYNKVKSAEKPFFNGFFMWLDDDLGYIGKVKCADKPKGGSS